MLSASLNKNFSLSQYTNPHEYFYDERVRHSQDCDSGEEENEPNGVLVELEAERFGEEDSSDQTALGRVETWTRKTRHNRVVHG